MSTFIDTIKETSLDIISKEASEPLGLVKNYMDLVLKKYKESSNTKTAIDEISVDGLDANQVWWQTKMVVDSTQVDLMNDIQEMKAIMNPKNEGITDDSDGDSIEEKQSEESEDEGSDVELNEEEEEEEENEEDVIDADLQISSESNDEAFPESAPKSDLDDDSNEGTSPEIDSANGVDDAFFNLEEFNKQTLAQEAANPDELDHNGEDGDEDIDYFADIPSEEDEEAIYYDDFFDKPTEKKRLTHSKDDDLRELDDEDYDSAMNSAKLDLFEEDNYEQDNAETELEGEQVGQSKLSTFEKQQLEIQKQIEKLEDEAIAEKKWALKGEVKAKDRPEDALLTEDLEFERTAKPVPVITAEITESLEDMIRRRIQDEKFDDLAKRTINDLSERQRKPKFELSDAKSSKSLAELYENDYNGIPDDSEISEELQKAHEEITEMFTNLNYKLDALSSAHFVPRPAQKALEVRVESAAVTMEDAQPLTMSSASTLAPQEIYKVGKSDNQNEIRLKNGTLLSKDELTREDKNRLRRAMKRRRSKKQSSDSVQPSKKNKRNDVIETLSKAKNLTVINQKGEKHDVKGNVKRGETSNKGGNVKL
ncbi:hypothetical protein NCAS_0D02860 [Naumovozyma castellii]|uniref:U3 small nucleolar ribonucleoprotein protein MPP10 n=1 Tax=Naumovozyma castellii TaxID=27288 RepID=G0VE76_NAUCA|nr:hypothetical protein NCAS_0D02860 [Naumovozyma castellii CBS 4309]CCC69867.1 hypothetical protein NCAS_0D02860 [Naumovozyma castellii CBS 4309]